MFKGIRQTGQGIFAKLMLVILVISFGIWGIGDIFRHGGGPNSAATVGGTSISMQEYQLALRHKQDEMRQMLGNSYKPGMMKQFGISAQVLFSLVKGLLIEKEAASLGITVGDDDIAETIRTNAAFQDREGHFDKSLYFETLRNNGISEQTYISNLRRSSAAKLLTGTVLTGIVVPEEMVQMVYKVREEQRVADLVLIPASAVSAVPEPTEKEIQTYYEAHTQDKGFTLPEYRTLSYIEIKQSDVQSHADISADDLKHAYDDRIQEFHKPERRVMQQMLFANKADADAAAAKLAHGARFADVAKSAPILNKGKLEMGDSARQDLPPGSAEQVFALKEGTNSQPIQSDFGWHIFYIEKIKPENTEPLEEVRASLMKDLAAKQSQETLYKLVGNLEDALAGGASIDDAAKSVGAKAHAFGPVAKDGTAPGGKTLSVPADGNLLNVAFSINENEHSQAFQTDDGSYILVRVDAVSPEHARPLAEVKSQVVAGWKQEKRQALLQTMAQDISGQLHNGKKLSEVLSSHDISVSPFSSGRLKRTSEKADSGTLAGKTLPHDLVAEIFHAKLHENTHAYDLPGDGMVIATVSQIIPAPSVKAQPGKDAMQPIRDELKNTLAEEVLDHYLNYLRDKHHVSVNEAILGASEENNE